jgi:hypothetical protein
LYWKNVARRFLKEQFLQPPDAELATGFIQTVIQGDNNERFKNG